MKKIVALVVLIVTMLACGLAAPVAAPTVTAAAPATQAPTITAPATEAPTAAVPATEAPTATAPVTEAPTAAPISLPQQWNGSLSGGGMVAQNASLVIEGVEGSAFKGKMIWVATGGTRQVITNVEGKFVTDFSTEESRWSFLEDYKKGDRSGTWLKWTETSFVTGTDAILGIRYYAHADKGKMTVIFFANDTDPKPYTANLKLSLVAEKIPDLPAITSFAKKFDPGVLNGPQQWSGTYTQTGLGKMGIGILIEEVDGQKFKGKMTWQGMNNIKGATTIISGEYVTDFTAELAKWNKHEDYQKGITSGSWLKWTETGFAKGSGYTLGGWYYGHIRDDGTMVGIYFLNEDITSLATSDFWVLKMK